MSKLRVKIKGHSYQIQVQPSGESEADFTVLVDDLEVPVSLPGPEIPFEQLDWIVVGNRPYEIVIDPELRWIKTGTGRYPIEVRDLEVESLQPVSKDGRVKAPIPGLVGQVSVQPGDTVAVGQPLLILEAMKMENEIRAPRSGTVARVNVSPGEEVNLHQVMVEIV
jgi:biotin carboxyl carrier protein